MNNSWIVLALLVGGLFFLRRRPQSEPGLIGVNTGQAGFGGFDADDPW